MGLSEAPRDSKIWAEAQVISLRRNDIKELGPTCFHCPLLLRFIVSENVSLGRIHHGFFQHMPALTYLDLCGTAITELPPDIGELKMLQHLDLSFTRITCLPKEVGNLLKLRYLDLSYTWRLKDVPSGVISRLLQLQVLDVFECGKDDGNDNDKVGDGSADRVVGPSSLEMAVDKVGDSRAIFMSHGVIDRILLDLESSLQLGGSLKALSIVVLSCEQFQRLSKMPRIFTRRLGIRGLRGLSPLNLTRNMWRHALELDIYNCTDTRVLIFDGAAVENDDCCPAKRLNFKKLYKLEEIIWRGLRPTVFLPYLCRVRIIECHRLKNVSWVVQLPSLTELELSFCNGLEQVIGGAEAEEIQHLEATTFPSLTKLSLVNLPELTGICGSATITFPALQSLHVRGCPKLMLPESPERPTVFPSCLQQVVIQGCHRLKNVSWVVQLPSLTELKLSECNGLEQVIGGAEAEKIQHLEATTFPSLAELRLVNLSELTCICGSAAIAFPALQRLEVIGCPKLKELPNIPERVRFILR